MASIDDPILRGNRAAEIINNELWVEAFDALKQAYLVEALKVGQKDDLGRFRLIEAIRQVDTVRSHFEAILANGKLAAHQAETFREQKPLLRRLF